MKLFLRYTGFVLGCFLMGAGSSGCSSASEDTAGETPQTSMEEPSTPSTGYLDRLGSSRSEAMATAGKTTLEQAIALFEIQEGRYPRNMEELQTKGHLPKLPDPPPNFQWHYDPDSGSISLIPSE